MGLILSENLSKTEPVYSSSPKDISFTEDKEYVFEENDSLVSKEVKTIGYTREDGLFVPTYLLIISKYKGGTCMLDSIKAPKFSEEQIMEINGINPHVLSK